MIDPPFITADVGSAETARLLLRPGGLVVLTTVIENAPLLTDLFGVFPRVWLPSIPNLPYQYAAYTNFDAPRLSKPNPEVPHDPDAFLASASRGSGAAEQSSRDDERPIQASGAGPGGAYDFDEMVRRAEAEEEARRAAAA